jgi:hypothetical protein
LARLGYPGTVELAATVLHRGDLNDAAVAIIVEALADLSTPPARDLVREFVQKKTELLAEPQALRGVLKIVEAAEMPDILSRFMTALQWRGAQRAGEGFRTLMDALAIDDCGWCFRTGPSGRIELRKTIKAVESGYDCDILTAMGEATIKQIAQRFRAGDHADIVHAIADWTCTAAAKSKGEPDNEDPARLSAAVTAFGSSPILEASEKLGHQFQQWVVGFELSAAFAVARGVNPQAALKRARGDVDKLLKLAELETAFLLPDLPAAIAVLCREDAKRARKAQDWCLRMLEAQGPFFPKVVALETLGELRAVHFIPEVMEYLSDENSYVYGAAERALSLMGDKIFRTGFEPVLPECFEIPFDDLPWQFDPEDGLIVTANNAAVDVNYPHFVAQEWDPGFRAERILDQIGLYGADGLTVDEMRRIQYDDSPLAPRDIVPLLEGATPATDDGTTIASRISDWQGACDQSSLGCAAFNAWLYRVERDIFDDALGTLARDYVGSPFSWVLLRQLLDDPNSAWWDDSRTPGVTETSDAIVARAMDEAGAELRAAFGSPAGWSWGRVHTATFREATLGTSGIGPLEWYFNEGPRAVPGTAGAVNNTYFHFSSAYPDPTDPDYVPVGIDHVFDMTNMPSYRLTIDMHDLDGARLIITTGQSGNPFDRHYNDQIGPWIEGETVSLPFTPAAISAAAASTLTLTP